MAQLLLSEEFAQQEVTMIDQDMAVWTVLDFPLGFDSQHAHHRQLSHFLVEAEHEYLTANNNTII